MSAARRLALGLWLTVAVVPVIADEAPVKATVTVLVTPPAVQPGEGVTVSGIAPLDAKGAVTVRITPPGGKPPVELRVNPSANGDYSVNFRGTTWAGEYKVGAVSPGGRVTGQGVFTVAVMEPLNEIDEAGQEARKIEAEIRKVTADIDTQVALLPATPEASQLKAKWSTLKPQLLQAARDAGDIDGLLEPLPAAARQDPGLRPALLPFAKKLDDWTKLARPERERISRELAKSKHANIKCENLERLKEGFNYAAALLNLTGGLFNAIKSVAVDYVAAQVAKTVDEKAKAFSKNFGFPAGESTKVAIAFTEAAAKGKWGGNKTVLKLAAKENARGSVFGVLADAAAFAADRLFNASCERMSGPIQGFMHADFFARSTGEVWWNYDIHYSGKLELRYPKNANSGEASSVTGEFMGQQEEQRHHQHDTADGLHPEMHKSHAASADGREQMVEICKDRRHHPSRHHRMGMNRHFRMIMAGGHVDTQHHAANGIGESKHKKESSSTLHRKSPLSLSPPGGITLVPLGQTAHELSVELVRGKYSVRVAPVPSSEIPARRG